MPVYTGTEGNDAFAPTVANMGLSYTISANGGDDTMSGGNVNDSIYLGAGHDIGYGKDGDDFIDGGSGDDSIQGQNGNDTIYGGSGSDYLYGGAGNDHIYGQSGLNYLIGEGGQDTYYVDFNNTPRLDVILDSSGTSDKLVLSNAYGTIYFDRVNNDLYLTDAYDMQDGYMDEYVAIIDFYNGTIPGAGTIEYLTIGNSTWNLWDLASGVT